MRAAGYEIIDAFALSTGDPSIQGREDGYHIGHALTDALIDLTFNQASAKNHLDSMQLKMRDLKSLEHPHILIVMMFVDASF